MKEITIGGSTYKLSETSQVFLKKYLEKMKNYIKTNKIDADVYSDIEERIVERFNESLKKKVKKELTDGTIIEAVNEI
jgi:cobalamin biosynthesis protein CbiD